MKVVAINGSPHLTGNTFQVIETVMSSIKEEGIETEVLQVSSKSIRGCTGCGACAKTFRCVQKDAAFHEFADRIYTADGLFIAAPVYYDAMPGQLKTFLDRLFFQDRSGGGLRHKVAAAASIQRRTGGVANLDSMYRFFLAAGMIIAPSVGENLIYGMDQGEAQLDVEGMDIMRKLGKNMVWMLKVLEATYNTIPAPTFVERKYMNFIRE